MPSSPTKKPDDSSSKHPRKPEDSDKKGDAKSGAGEDNQHKKGDESPHDYIK